MLLRLVLAAGMGLAAGAAPPAVATVDLVCFSVGLECQSYSCPPGTVQVFNNGFNDTGPWLVVCRPRV